MPLGSETAKTCSLSVSSFSASFARSVGTPHLNTHDPHQGPWLHLGGAAKPLRLPTPSAQGSGGCITPAWAPGKFLPPTVPWKSQIKLRFHETAERTLGVAFLEPGSRPGPLQPSPHLDRLPGHLLPVPEQTPC